MCFRRKYNFVPPLQPLTNLYRDNLPSSVARLVQVISSVSLTDKIALRLCKVSYGNTLELAMLVAVLRCIGRGQGVQHGPSQWRCQHPDHGACYSSDNAAMPPRCRTAEGKTGAGSASTPSRSFRYAPTIQNAAPITAPTAAPQKSSASPCQSAQATANDPPRRSDHQRDNEIIQRTENQADVGHRRRPSGLDPNPIKGDRIRV